MASIIDINKEITQALQKSGKFDEAEIGRAHV